MKDNYKQEKRRQKQRKNTEKIEIVRGSKIHINYGGSNTIIGLDNKNPKSFSIKFLVEDIVCFIIG